MISNDLIFNMAMTSKKYLIVSPVSKGGGIALDVGFIGDLLSKNNHVNIITTNLYYEDSEIFYFNKQLHYTSLDRLVYKNSFLIKLFAKLLSIIKPHPEEAYNRINNKLFQKVFNLRKKRLAILKRELTKYDVIIICNQLTGSYIKEVVSLLPDTTRIVHRVTGQILDRHLISKNKEWLKKITCFIHHSERNKKILAPFLPDAEHHIIDQCAYDQNRFLNIPHKQQLKRFFTFSRLHDLKQIDTVVHAFKKLPQSDLSLHIYGNGPEEMALKTLAKDDHRIYFYDTISFKDAHNVYAENDCLIISSRIEAGPYTGIEAMAAGGLIISTRVGAMETRLPDYPFFYNGTIEELTDKIVTITNLSPEAVRSLSIAHRNNYLNSYDETTIKESYLAIF